MRTIGILIIVLATMLSCKTNTKDVEDQKKQAPFIWEGANLYFLLTDRFHNADPSNDVNFDRTEETAKLRGFEGGDLKGVTQKIEEGYFTDLGVNAIWMTPVVEQIHGGTNEGTGVTYGYHGYWAKDWTSLDPNFGTKADLKNLIEAAHKKGIRILLDAVVNHTGPVTKKDPVWPNDWVRTEPTCTYDNYENTVSCTLVDNLPDILTESDDTVALPPQLVEKWKAEGRYDQEMEELDAFFEITGHPRAPRFYIMKWLSDYITEFGIDGYRVDTVKHTEAYVWQEFRTICDVAFAEFKKNNPEKVLDDNGFYLVGEVYNYGISAGKAFDFGDKKVNYFDASFNSLINFELKWNAKQKTKQQVFKRYSDILNGNLKGYGVLNYLSSHDDGQPFDPNRDNSYETATLLMLTPGTSQLYYGDESARRLVVEGTEGDANLRSPMNWEDIQSDEKTKAVLQHWQKLGQFRANHPAVGAGVHHMISKAPYVFSRTFSSENFNDKVVVALDLKSGPKTVNVSQVFEDGSVIRDAYSNQEATVKDGQLTIDSNFEILLLEQN
ncbi:alpha-amylase family glycosyl hydrolase [Sediminibacter sp. Hel_I_10]|uniref:alpha-amylase family glycosyl hydrolase n=1 Tax=Sediminibacter sp. Hel_I_10 TaxID=1392490 RepID=UPI00047D6BB1|nr:alpha-amylase family glycosyl hydrolase [Sediminibacter sp. Hel_I_10]